MKMIPTFALTALLAAALPAAANPETTTPIKQQDTTAQLLELLPDGGTPKLWFGSKAPKLKLAGFVKGEPVDGFTEGQVYVVEFWATWCGPCIASMPHITKLQKDYGDKVRVIGVNIWDREFDRKAKEFTESPEDYRARIEAFIEKKGKKVGYRVALEDEQGMSKGWMKPAEQNGIPASFIVDGDGLIAWMGHPMGLDEPLEKIIAGEYDLEAEAAAAKKGTLMQSAMMAFMEGIRSDDEGEVKKAEKIASILARADDADPMLLNAIAWTIVDETEAVSNRNYKLAYRVAKKACEQTDWNDPMIIDTYALAAFKAGKTKMAINKQKLAIKLLGEMDDIQPEIIEEFEQRLAMFEEEG